MYVNMPYMECLGYIQAGPATIEFPALSGLSLRFAARMSCGRLWPPLVCRVLTWRNILVLEKIGIGAHKWLV